MPGCRDTDAQDGEMQRRAGCKDDQDTYSEMPSIQRCPGCGDKEIPGIQRCRNAQGCKEVRERGRAPATTNTCGFGLHTLTPGASSKENLGLEADTGMSDGFHVLHTMCLQMPSLPCCAELPRDSKSWTELI